MRVAGGLARRLRAFGRDRGGGVTILVAAFSVCLVASVAITVDVANLYLERRREQGALDLAALAAARDLTRAETAARAVLAANGVASPKTLTVTLGSYAPDRGASADKRFRANAAPTNAVRLQMTNDAPLFFGKSILKSGTAPIEVRSSAVNTRVASLSIGSKLATLNGGVANALLSRLLGGSVSLSAMDYDALAAANVSMPDLLKALASRVGVTAGSYDDVLSVQPTIGQFAAALSDAAGGSGLLRTALASIASIGSSKRIDLRQLLSFGPFAQLSLGQDPGLSVSASALELLTTALGIANQSSQVDLDLGAQIPGLLGLTASLVIGERPQSSPWLAIGPEGVTVRTAQTRLRLIAQVAGTGGLPGLRLPIAIDLASGLATLSTASCGANPRTSRTATVSVTPAVADIWVGEPKKLSAWNDPSKGPDVGPATIVDALLLSVSASAHVATTNLRPQKLEFSASDIERNAVRTASTADVAQSTLSSLTNNLSISVKLLGLTLGSPQTVTALVGQILKPVGAQLDPVLNQVLGLLGVGLGEADVTVRGLRCDGSALIG